MATIKESREALAALRASVSATSRVLRSKDSDQIRDAYASMLRTAEHAASTMPVPSSILRNALRGLGETYFADAPERANMGSWYTSMACIEEANRRGGFHFFEAGARRFFSSRPASYGYQGAHCVYFVTSERYSAGARLYSVRRMDADGSIDGFQAFGNAKTADKRARSLAAESRAKGGGK